jgi:translation initiation factor 2 subunit 1
VYLFSVADYTSFFLSFPKLTGYIDLSKRRVSPEDITKCEERFMKARTVSSIMRHVASRLPTFDPDAEGSGDGGGGGGDAIPAESKQEKDGEAVTTATTTDEVASLAPPTAAAGSSEEERLEKLYEHVAWPLGRKYGNVYDAFKLSLTQVLSTFLFHLHHLSYILILCRESDTVFATVPQPVPQATYNLLMATIARRLTPQPIKLRADIELTCYTPSGIEAIKNALRAGEKASTEAVPIKAKLVAPPLYVLSTNATDKVRDKVGVGARHMI